MKTKNLLICIGIVISFSFTTIAQTIPSYVPSNGLVGWWPFNGNAVDESGNGNNGTVNGATLTTDRFGNTNSAYDFNANAKIICPQNNIPTNAFSISVWINQDNSFGNMQYVCLGSSVSTRWGVVASNNNIYVGYGAGCSGTGGNILNTTALTTGAWIHLVYISSGVGGISQIYKNGIYIGQAQNSISTGGCSNQNLYFGVDIFSISEYIDGKLDDIGIWNRALTQQEITTLYNGCQNNTIMSQPTNQTAVLGTNAVFTVSATVGSTLQWQTDLGLGFQNLSNAGQYSGVNTPTLTISNVGTNNNNQIFRCIVGSGSCSDTTSVVTLNLSQVGVEELMLLKNIELYPNPVSSELYIKCSEKYRVLKVLNNIGEQVLNSGPTNRVDVSSISSGIYFIKLYDEKGKLLKIGKFIKE